MDVERGSADYEREALLSPEKEVDHNATEKQQQKRSFSVLSLFVAFVTGAAACLISQHLLCGSDCIHGKQGQQQTPAQQALVAPPWVGSSVAHHYPPPSPTNTFPTLFPTNVGYPGGTPTGVEPALVATGPSWPIHSGAPVLLTPASLPKYKAKDSKSDGFDMFKHWGNLAPWYSVGKGAFGVESDPGAPDGCSITGLHFLHRHGARYPTGWTRYGSPGKLASRLHQTAAQWNATGDLEFLNRWSYKLGEEILTPFGRQQLFDLGVSMRLKYGYLLQNFTESNTIPVFRTESQDRMLNSALNFAIGFFGLPIEGQYQQSITIEAPGFNNTLAPYTSCPSSGDWYKAGLGAKYASKWANIYLADALERFSKQLPGFTFMIEDVYSLQLMCAYETVALGYSKFCTLFTEEEWRGFSHYMDVYFWYDSSFGAPTARSLGIGYVQELIARLTRAPIQTHNSSTNSTLNDDPRTFPLGQSLYVDATHEVVVLNVITALNLTGFAEAGAPPWTHIPTHKTFKVSEMAPFATNVQFQLLTCASTPEQQIRIVINDGVVPLTGIRGCPTQKDGMCPLPTFIAAQKEIIQGTDWEWGCKGDWDIPEGWETTTGDPPAKPKGE